MTITIILAFFAAFVITYTTIPVIITIGKKKHLFDEPDHRTSHKDITPTLGGMGIFIGFILSITLFVNFAVTSEIQYFVFAMVVVFFTGMKDDILIIDSRKKTIGLLIAISALVVLGDVRISSFYGLLGVFELNYGVSIFISLLTFFVIINSMNLIDGINGLSSSSALISSLAFGIWFYLDGGDESMQIVTIIAALVGSLLGFLRFNISPAKIFMGDTGSLLVGVILAFLAIKFLEINWATSSTFRIANSSPGVAVGFLAIPLFDMLRVAILRLLRKQSPFKPDKNHIHHNLIDLGFSHMKATFILAIISIFFAIASVYLAISGVSLVILIVAIFALIITSIPYFYLSRKNKQKKAKEQS